MAFKFNGVVPDVIRFIDKGVTTILDKLISDGVTVWENWILKSVRTSIGSAGNSGYVTKEQFDWSVPSNYRVVTLYCLSSVYCHVDIDYSDPNVAPATVTATIEGWNGSEWVEVAKGKQNGCDTKGSSASSSCSYTFDPYNTTYDKFRFISGGTSFYRDVTGYIDKWYQKGNG